MPFNLTTTESHDIDYRTEYRPLIDWIFSEDGHRHHEFDPYSMAGGRVGFEGSLTRKSHTAWELLLHGHSYTNWQRGGGTSVRASPRRLQQARIGSCVNICAPETSTAMNLLLK